LFRVLRLSKDSRSRVPPAAGSRDIWTFLSSLGETEFFSILLKLSRLTEAE